MKREEFIKSEYREYQNSNKGFDVWEEGAYRAGFEAALRYAKLSLPPADATAEEILKKQIRQLKEFHTAFNLPQRNIPTIIPAEEFKLRHKILMEEVGELSDAYFVDDIVEVADAITDCLYVLIGTALQFGLADKLEACFDEVHRSNMSKLGDDGKPIMREDGKVMKGTNYSHPNLAQILNEQRQPQPTAEGAEEMLTAEEFIREKLRQKLGIKGEMLGLWKYLCNGEDALRWAHEFATLHAQRLADKMVSERLREEYERGIEDGKVIQQHGSTNYIE